MIIFNVYGEGWCYNMVVYYRWFNENKVDFGFFFLCLNKIVFVKVQCFVYIKDLINVFIDLVKFIFSYLF